MFVGTRRLDPYRDDAATYKVNPYKLKDIQRKVDFSKMKRRESGRVGKQSKDELKQKNDYGMKNSKALELHPQSGAVHKVEEKPRTNRLASYSRDTLHPKVSIRYCIDLRINL